MYLGGTVSLASLNGTERVVVDNGSAGRITECTTAQIAALAAEGAFVITPITTAGNGTLTAAALLGGEVLRSGPSGAFTDTTDTAAAIIASLPGVTVGETYRTLIKNTTAFPMTLAAGVGVTLPTTVVIPPFSIGSYVVDVTSATAVSFFHLGTNPIAVGAQLSAPALTALTTVGAGTITAAGVAGGFTARSGTQSAAFTDTTDTAAAIIAASAQLVGKVGASMVYQYNNNTAGAGGYPATITGGSGVTVSGITVVPAQSWAEYIITQTATGVLTMVGVAQGFFPHSGTVTANAGTPVVVSDANVTPGSNIILTYASGTVGATGAFVEAKTAGTSFSIKSVTSDGALYNYTILG